MWWVSKLVAAAVQLVPLKFTSLASTSKITSAPPVKVGKAPSAWPLIMFWKLPAPKSIWKPPLPSTSDSGAAPLMATASTCNFCNSCRLREKWLSLLASTSIVTLFESSKARPASISLAAFSSLTWTAGSVGPLPTSNSSSSKPASIKPWEISFKSSRLLELKANLEEPLPEPKAPSILPFLTLSLISRLTSVMPALCNWVASAKDLFEPLPPPRFL